MRDMANSITIKHNYPLREHNTFGLDVKAKQFINYNTIDELVEVLGDINAIGAKITRID